MWKPIETAPRYKTVLTQHVDDLFPVAASFIGGDYWAREMEGPEDLEPPQEGRWAPLYRTPTHWMPLPDPPDKAGR